MDDAFITQDDAFNIRRIADTDNNDLSAGCSFPGRCRAFGAFGRQAFFFLPGPIVDNHLMTRFEDVHCHSDSHSSHTDECDFHIVPP
jgi:hypothetical protein